MGTAVVEQPVPGEPTGDGAETCQPSAVQLTTKQQEQNLAQKRKSRGTHSDFVRTAWPLTQT